MSRWSERPPCTVRSPPAIAAANAQVPATIRSETVSCCTGRSRSTPCTTSVEVEMPSIWAPISHEHLAQVDDLRLAGDVVDDRGALGEHRGHQQVLGGADAREVQPQVAARQAVGHLGHHEPVLDAHLRAELGEAGHVHVQAARADVVAARQRHPGPAAARDQRAEHADRGAQPADQVVRRLVAQLVGHVDGRRAAGVAACRPAAGARPSTVQPSSSSSRAITCTSRMSGTFVTRVVRPGPAGRPPSASARCSWPRRRTPCRATGARAAPRTGPGIPASGRC